MCNSVGFWEGGVALLEPHAPPLREHPLHNLETKAHWQASSGHAWPREGMQRTAPLGVTVAVLALPAIHQAQGRTLTRG